MNLILYWDDVTWNGLKIKQNQYDNKILMEVTTSYHLNIKENWIKALSET